MQAKTFIIPTKKGIYESGNKVLNIFSFYIKHQAICYGGYLVGRTYNPGRRIKNL